MVLSMQSTTERKLVKDIFVSLSENVQGSASVRGWNERHTVWKKFKYQHPENLEQILHQHWFVVYGGMYQSDGIVKYKQSFSIQSGRLLHQV